MAKPSRTKKSRTSRPKAPASQPVDVVEAAPPPTPDEGLEAKVEELEADIAKFDHDGDGHPGGSLPHSAGGAEPAKGDVIEEAASAATEPSAPSDFVDLGPVKCRLREVETDAVLGLLSENALRRVSAQLLSPTFEPTRERMLATDGRATPIVFEDGDPPNILHGYDELAAAVDIGRASVSVLLVPAGGASEAQQHIVEMVRQQRMKNTPPDDDELFYRVHAED